jgi:hypothetical protein
MAVTRLRCLRWVSVVACTWAALFAVPHALWALGIPAGFPGGAASYQVFMASRLLYLYNLTVIALSGVAVIVTIRLNRSTDAAPRHRLMCIAVWTASGALLLRGVAGLVVDGLSDPIWWPTFLTGGLLYGSVASLAWSRGVQCNPANPDLEA